MFYTVILAKTIGMILLSFAMTQSNLKCFSLLFFPLGCQIDGGALTSMNTNY